MSANEHVNVLVCGEGGIGKSSMIQRFMGESIPTTHDYTVGVDTKKFEYDNVSFNVCDSAGQERFHQLNHTYYKNIDIFLLCFDLSNKETFDKLQQYYDAIKEHGPKHAQIVIVGTKVDKVEERQVDDQTIEAFQQAHNLTSFKISSKDEINLEELQNYLAAQGPTIRDVRIKATTKPEPSKLATVIRGDKKIVPQSPVVLGLFAGVSGLTGAGLITACIVVAVITSSLWPLTLGGLGVIGVGAAFFFGRRAYHNYQEQQNSIEADFIDLKA